MTDLNDLAKTLAESLEPHGQVCEETRTSYEDCCCLPDWKKRRDKVEAVIREAIDQTLREALEIFGDSVTWTESQQRINDAIRYLKQSNSGKKAVDV